MHGRDRRILPGEIDEAGRLVLRLLEVGHQVHEEVNVAVNGPSGGSQIWEAGRHKTEDLVGVDRGGLVDDDVASSIDGVSQLTKRPRSQVTRIL